MNSFAETFEFVKTGGHIIAFSQLNPRLTAILYCTNYIYIENN